MSFGNPSRSFARVSRRSLALLPLAALVACSQSVGGEGELGTSDAPIVSMTSPYEKPYEYTFVPSLEVSGYSAAPQGPWFSDGRDVAQGALPYTATDWIPIARGGFLSEYESSPAFQTHLQSAIDDSDSNLKKIDEGTLLDLADLLQRIPGLHVTPRPVSRSFAGYKPVQARWAKMKYSKDPSYTGLFASEALKRYDYPDPSSVGEIRRRGARLYCAARRAIREQAARPDASLLGEQVAIPLKIFGHKVDIGVLQATLAIDGPERYTGAPPGSPSPNDGAQAFKVPLLAGARVIPIRGLAKPLEAFPEIRHPVVMVTGDSEVVSALPKKSIVTGGSWFCWWGGCKSFRRTTTDHPEIDQTVTHANAIASSAAGLDASVRFPLYNVGMLKVEMELAAGITLGERTNANDRLWKGAPSPWPTLARPDMVSDPKTYGGSFDDSSWTMISPWYGASFDYTLQGRSSALGTIYQQEPWEPLAMRALHDDDHHVATKTGLTLDATVTGTVSASMGPLDIRLEAAGNLGGGFFLEHHIRDGLAAYKPSWVGSTPYVLQSNLLVVPQTSSTVSVNLDLDLFLHMPIPFFDDLNFHEKLIHEGTEKIFASKPWPETSRLRLGTGSNSADPTNKPATMSHLASTGGTSDTFDTFSDSVDTCLADAAPNPAVPKPCGASDGPVQTPRANVCVVSRPKCDGAGIMCPPGGFGSAAEWAGACTNTTATAASMAGSWSGPLYECYRRALAYLCSPVARTLAGGAGVSHILEMGTSDGRFADVISTCVAAAPPGTVPAAVVHDMFTFTLCDDTALPMSSADAIVMPSDKTTPEPVNAVPGCVRP